MNIMSRQRADKSEYRVYYGVDSNAALKPQYVPQPKSDKKTQERKRREAKAARRFAVLRCWAFTLCAMVVAAMAFLIVTRNAEIYSNNRQIRNLAKEKTNMQILINTVEKEGSAGNEINSYFEIAENRLGLQYPKEESIVKVVLPAAFEEEVQETEESIDLYDAVLDFFSSLGKGD